MASHARADAAQTMNLLQQVPYRINRRVLGVVLEAQRRGLRVKAGPLRAVLAALQQGTAAPAASSPRPDLVRAWHRGRAYDGLKHAHAAAVHAAREVIGLAVEFAEHPRLYLPLSWTLGEGIRPLAEPLDPWGSDLARALLEFAEGRAVTQGTAGGSNAGNGGDGWLALQTAWAFGLTGPDHDGRIAWVFEHEAHLRRIAADPFADLSWAEAERPWCALAATFALVAFLDAGPGYVSHLPVSVEARPMAAAGFTPQAGRLLAVAEGAHEEGIVLAGFTGAPCVTHAASGWEAMNVLAGSDAMGTVARRRMIAAEIARYWHPPSPVDPEIPRPRRPGASMGVTFEWRRSAAPN